jgi:hypothetical protein
MMPDRSRKRPRDPNQLAKLIVDLATGEAGLLAVAGGRQAVVPGLLAGVST